MRKAAVKMLKASIGTTLAAVRALTGPMVNPERKISVCVGHEGNVEEFERRLVHFAPHLRGLYSLHPRLGLRHVLSAEPVITLDSRGRNRLHALLGTVNLDFERCPHDAWQWFSLAQRTKQEETDANVAAGRARFVSLGLELAKRFDRAYIFGTGPSLAKAIEIDWSNGIRIVSNTIVKDQDLWAHINPHFIVAGDALYHFGHTPFAISFRTDLRKRLGETGTLFLYPAMFDSLVQREFPDFRDRLVPVPHGASDSPIGNLLDDYALPFLGNVLNQLLLPVSTSLTKCVFLWGFDGRAPSDQLFWKNSNRHFYEEHVPALQAAHPAFFSHHVPTSNPNAYVKSVHGDELDQQLSAAEAQGYTFNLLHDSWTATLKKRQKTPEEAGVKRV